MGKLIIVADDDTDDMDFFHMAMNIVDHEATILSFADGEEVLNFLEVSNSIKPDFIFLDINMPRCDGKTCLKELKKNPRLKNIPVVICSTANSTREISDVMELGATTYITKPANLKELAYAIHLLINSNTLL